MNRAHPSGLVLNVDDHDSARYVKTRALQEGGYEVLEADTGPAAIELAIERRPDLILLDVKLPGIDGFEACRRLRADPRTRSISIVHTSASFTGSEDRVRGLEGGADAYITAPIESRVLLATVGALMRARRAEEALRESEMRFRSMADAAPLMIWLADPSSDVTWFNRGWLEFTGRKEDHAGVGSWSDLVHPADRDNYVELLRRSIADRQSFEVEYRLRRADGEYRWIHEQGVVQEESAQFAGFIGSGVDVTDRRKLDEARTQALAHERAARFEGERLNRVKDEFLATLSHELRTPLNAILGWTRVLQTPGLPPAEVEKGLTIIERNSKLQAQLIDDLLDVSRIISGKLRLELQRVSLADVVDAALGAVKPAAETKGIRLLRHVDLAVQPVHGDPARLQQVVWNLLSNSVRFTPAGGEIEVRVEPRGDDDVAISVRDTGQGIDLAFLPFVFDAFRQADASTTRQHGGLGLGLSIVRKLVEMHRGRVTATSPGPGRGATFTVTLPARYPLTLPEHAAAAHGAGSTATAAEPAVIKGRRILVVDDDADARDLMERIFTDRGARVNACETASQALAALDAFQPEIIVSDIAMPEQDGYDLLRVVRAAGYSAIEVPAIALTAFARADDSRQAIAAGFQVHIAKPVEPDALVAEVARLLESRT